MLEKIPIMQYFPLVRFLLNKCGNGNYMKIIFRNISRDCLIKTHLYDWPNIKHAINLPRTTINM